MKQLIIMWSNNSDRMSVEKLGDLCAYDEKKAPYFYVIGERSSVVRVFQGDSTRKYITGITSLIWFALVLF